MNAIGMCAHNNISGYCPSCVKEKEARKYKRKSLSGDEDCQPGGNMYKRSRMQQYGQMGHPMQQTGQMGRYDQQSSGQMGIDLNFNDLLSNAVQGAKDAAGAAIVKQATADAGVQAQLQAGVANSLSQKIVAAYNKNPTLFIAGGLAVAALLVYGAMSFVRGK